MAQTPARMRINRVTSEPAASAEDRPIRAELVRQVRAQILAGEYDSPAKIEAAAERLAGVLDLVV